MPRGTGQSFCPRRPRQIIAKPVEPTYSGAVIAGVAQAIEAVLLGTLGMAIHGFYVGHDQPLYALLTLIAVAIANILLNGARTHRVAFYRTLPKQLLRVLAAWSLAFTIIAVGLVLFKASDMVSRVWLVSWYAGGAVLLILYRVALRALMQNWTRDGKLKLRTVIVGGGRDAEELINAIRKGAENDILLLGLFDDRHDERSPETVAGLRKLGKVADLIEFARQTRVDLVIVSMPLSAETRVLEMLKQLWVLPVDIRLSAHMSKLRFTRHAYSYVGQVPVFDVVDRPITDWNLVFKWLFDKIVSVIALILFSPDHVGDGHRHQAREQGPGVLPAEAAGLQQ